MAAKLIRNEVVCEGQGSGIGEKRSRVYPGSFEIYT
jgi:hypothetical protein